jgi:hypothetical protein
MGGFAAAYREREIAADAVQQTKLEPLLSIPPEKPAALICEPLKVKTPLKRIVRFVRNGKNSRLLFRQAPREITRDPLTHSVA